MGHDAAVAAYEVAVGASTADSMTAVVQRMAEHTGTVVEDTIVAGIADMASCIP